LQAYFIPQPRPGSRPFRGFSPRAATLPHRKELAPVSLDHAERDCSRSTPRSPTCAGCHAIRPSTSRPSSARGSVRCVSVIHRAARRSPPRVCLLQALASHGRSQLTRDLRSRRSRPAPSLSRSRTALVPSVSPARSPANTSPLHRPARGFKPSLRTLRATGWFVSRRASDPVSQTTSSLLPSSPSLQPTPGAPDFNLLSRLPEKNTIPRQFHQPGCPRDESGATRFFR
jgi:hypothetical protein